MDHRLSSQQAKEQTEIAEKINEFLKEFVDFEEKIELQIVVSVKHFLFRIYIIFYFYSIAYEILAKRTAEFAKLQGMLRDGYQLIICGYDAFDLREEPEHDLYWHYCNPGRPFGHELVLYALVTIEDPQQYPWRRYRREHPTLYEGIAHMTTE